MGVSFMEGNCLKFCEVVDSAPEFAQLQALKFSLRPALIVIPANSDTIFADRCRAPTTTPAKPEVVEGSDLPGLDLASGLGSGFDGVEGGFDVKVNPTKPSSSCSLPRFFLFYRA